jgi:hypothetical protein
VEAWLSDLARRGEKPNHYSLQSARPGTNLKDVIRGSDPVCLFLSFSLESRLTGRLPFCNSTSAGAISFSSDGDLVQLLDPLTIRLHTTADIARPAFPPRLEVYDPSIPVPAQVSVLGSVASTMASFFGRQRVYSAAEIDAIREFLVCPFAPISVSRFLPSRSST